MDFSTFFRSSQVVLKKFKLNNFYVLDKSLKKINIQYSIKLRMSIITFMNNNKYILLIIFIVITILLASCSSGALKGTQTAVQELTPSLTPTPLEPSPTPIPLALTVNGDNIFLCDFEAELKRYQDAQTETGQNKSLEEQKQAVIADFIDQLLLSQAARTNGFEANEETVQSNIDKITSQLGGNEELTNWQNKYGYSPENFLRMLKLSIESTWQKEQIIASAPTSTEQVYARQILLKDEANAQIVYQQLSNGTDFETLAQEYDVLTGGYLGWFPRGYLLQPIIEEAAFALEPGQFSPIIETSLGYHIIQVIERDPDHILSPDALRATQRLAIINWLDEKRSNSQIEILVE